MDMCEESLGSKRSGKVEKQTLSVGSRIVATRLSWQAERMHRKVSKGVAGRIHKTQYEMDLFGQVG